MLQHAFKNHILLRESVTWARGCEVIGRSTFVPLYAIRFSALFNITLQYSYSRGVTTIEAREATASSFLCLDCFSRFAKPRDVIAFPYVPVQTAQTHYVYAAACALRDKMAARFVLMFVKPPRHFAEILRKLVVRYGNR